MKLLIALTGCMLWAAPLLAETYTWVDENGTYNFTEDYARVPKKYRKSVGKRGDMAAEPAKKEPVAPESAPQLLPGQGPKNRASEKQEAAGGTFGGKSLDQWKQELGELEAAMQVINRRVDELDAELKLLQGKPSNREQARALVAERNSLVTQFNELRKQYNQQVENARKAGITVNLK